MHFYQHTHSFFLAECSAHQVTLLVVSHLHCGSLLQLIFYLMQIRTPGIWLVVLVSLSLMLPSNHSHYLSEELSILPCGLMSQHLPPEGGATCDSERGGAGSTIGGGAVLLLPPPGIHSLSYPFSCRPKTLASCHLSIATDISHCDIALDFSQASLNIIFKFN